MKDFILKQFNINLTEDQLLRFRRYYEFLTETNEKFNLTAITEESAVFEKHFADSLAGVGFISQNATVVDVGSGAGFPSFPIAIVRPDVKVTAVDSLGKRVNFLVQLATMLKLNCVCVHSRAEDFARLHRQQFDVAVARAVAPLNILLEYTAPLVRKGGSVLCYKTDEEERQIAKNAEKILGLNYDGAFCFRLPSGDKRCVLRYTKIKDTPLAYPRGQNLPRKKPL